MISLLSRIFIKDRVNRKSATVRKAYGVLCGVVGICLNVFLFIGKFFAGRLSGSIAITADAFNNLSDAGSSMITLLGFELGGQKADREHPFGHGRLEYLSGLIVAMLIVLMGFELARSSLTKILHPESIQSGTIVIVILVVSIAVKLYMFTYNHRIGKRFSSPAMHATALDSLSDCAATTAVLVATLVSRFTGVKIDGWCGVLVSCFILYSGFSAARDTINPLLGQPPSPEYVSQIRNIVLAYPKVIGIHDLIVHDYGPGRSMISLHAEVSASENILELHDEIDNAEKELKEQLGCVAVIHMDPIVTDDGITTETRLKVEALVKCIDDQISIHDFRMVSGPTHTNVIFDAVVPFKFRLTDAQVAEKIKTAVRTLDGNYYAVVTVEKSYT